MIGVGIWSQGTVVFIANGSAGIVAMLVEAHTSVFFGGRITRAGQGTPHATWSRCYVVGKIFKSTVRARRTCRISRERRVVLDSSLDRMVREGKARQYCEIHSYGFCQHQQTFTTPIRGVDIHLHDCNELQGSPLSIPSSPARESLISGRLLLARWSASFARSTMAPRTHTVNWATINSKHHVRIFSMKECGCCCSLAVSATFLDWDIFWESVGRRKLE